MHRLFVACRPPKAVRDQLRLLMGGVEGAHWQSDEQLHITLRFIGNVDGRVAEEAAAALAAVHAPGFRLAISGIGHFDHKAMVHSLWAGVAPKEAITSLHRKIDRSLVMAGLAPEARAYLPHITLARFGGKGGNSTAIAAFAAAHAGFTTPDFDVTRFSLFESHRSASGMHYRPVATYALNAEGPPDRV